MTDRYKTVLYNNSVLIVKEDKHATNPTPEVVDVVGTGVATYLRDELTDTLEEIHE